MRSLLYVGGKRVNGVVGLSGDSRTMLGRGESVIELGEFRKTCFYETFKKFVRVLSR